MTVAELIAELRKHPPDMSVYCAEDDSLSIREPEPHIYDHADDIDKPGLVL